MTHWRETQRDYEATQPRANATKTFAVASSRERRTATCLPILAQPREQSIKDSAYCLHNSFMNGKLPIGRRYGQTTRGTDQPRLYRSFSHNKFTIDSLDVLQISFTQIQYTTCAPPNHIQQLYASNYLSTLQILWIPRSSTYYGRPPPPRFQRQHDS
jgi:hypothetical protein